MHRKENHATKVTKIRKKRNYQNEMSQTQNLKWKKQKNVNPTRQDSTQDESRFWMIEGGLPIFTRNLKKMHFNYDPLFG